MIYYTALFLNEENKKFLIDKFPAKHSNTFYNHITLQFKPEDISSIKLGAKMSVKIVGRVSDEKGDALLVQGDFTSKNRFPHITISCIDGVEPVYSNEMIDKVVQNNNLEYFTEILEIEMTEGYCEIVFDEKGEWRVFHLGEYLETRELKTPSVAGEMSRFLK